VKTFEYKEMYIKTGDNNWSIGLDGKTYAYQGLERVMSKLGSDGWELVSVASIIGSEKPMGLEMSMTYTSQLIYSFKKELLDK